MLSYILRRLFLLVPTLVGVTAVVFFVMAAAPGGLGNIKAREGGALNQGMEAKKQLERTKRRYRLDLPVAEQYLWWLNKISPVGLRMSHRYEWPEADRAAVRAALSKLPLASNPAALDDGVRAVLDTAAYAGKAPMEVESAFAAALAKPSEGLGLLSLMDAKPFDPEAEARKLRDTEAHYGAGDAQAKFIELYRSETDGRSRLLWTKAPEAKVPDLGESLQGRSVVSLVAERLPVSLLINLITLPIIYGVSILAGIYAARRPGGRWDVSSAAAFMALWSVPTVVAGTLLQTFLTNQVFLRWFPTSRLHALDADAMRFLPAWGADGFHRGWLLDYAWALVLPVVCMTYAGFAELSRVMRGSMLEALSSDYIRTARAKGVREPDLLWRHAFRNSTLPLITMLAGVIPALIAGSVVVERIFDINGVGKLTVEAAQNKDPDLVMAGVLVGSLLVLLCDIGRDVAYAIADPRVSYE